MTIVDKLCVKFVITEDFTQIRNILPNCTVMVTLHPVSSYRCSITRDAY